MLIWITVDEYKYNHHNSIDKKPIDGHYSTLSKEIEKNPEDPKIKVRFRVRNKNIFFAKGIPKIGQNSYLWLILKTNP